MEKYLEDVLKEYQESDFDKRLYMFLHYRDERAYFCKIDEHELQASAKEVEKVKDNAWTGPVQRVVNALSWTFRRFIPV